MRANVDRRMPIGRLNQRVTIQEPLRTTQEDQITGWSDLAETWACIQPTDQKDTTENFESGREAAHQFAIVTMRYRSNLNTTHRLVHRGTAYDVRAVMDADSEKRFQQVLARSVL